MDPVRLGRQVRALRRRRGWRQVDLATAAGVARSTVSRVERGLAGGVTLGALERIAQVLGARLMAHLSWNGEALERLLDGDHAALVEQVADKLRGRGWEVAIEATFAVGGERGSVDVLGYHPARRVVVVVEVKTVVPDMQAMLSSLDRKGRLAGRIAGARGWSPRTVGRVLVFSDTRTSRRRVELHEATFRAAFPSRSVAVKRWIGDPDPERPFSGLWFLSPDRGVSARHRVPRKPGNPRA